MEERMLLDGDKDASNLGGLLVGSGRRNGGHRPLAGALASLLLEVDNIAVEIAATDGVEQACGAKEGWQG